MLVPTICKISSFMLLHYLVFALSTLTCIKQVYAACNKQYQTQATNKQGWNKEVGSALCTCTTYQKTIHQCIHTCVCMYTCIWYMRITKDVNTSDYMCVLLLPVASASKTFVLASFHFHVAQNLKIFRSNIVNRLTVIFLHNLMSSSFLVLISRKLSAQFLRNSATMVLSVLAQVCF